MAVLMTSGWRGLREVSRCIYMQVRSWGWWSELPTVGCAGALYELVGYLTSKVHALSSARASLQQLVTMGTTQKVRQTLEQAEAAYDLSFQSRLFIAATVDRVLAVAPGFDPSDKDAARVRIEAGFHLLAIRNTGPGMAR